MANTFELIASSTVGSGGAASIDFTSIPSTYTDLCIKFSLRDNNAQPQNGVLININSSTSNFTQKFLYGSGSAAGSTSVARLLGYNAGAGATANTFNNGEVYLPNYAGLSNKSFSADVVQETNATTAYAVLSAHLWSITSAITAVSLIADTASFVQYSTAYLYGVKNA